MECDIKLWKSLRQPFLVPERIHRCKLRDWELIDCDVAGCLVCGAVHKCNDTHQCPTIADEGRHICEITGFYTRRNVFVDDEYIDTVANITTQHVPTLRFIEYPQIEAWVSDLLCSANARSAIEQEIIKRTLRTKTIFVKLAKQVKVRRVPLNVLEIFTQTVHEMSNIRHPKLLTHEEACSLAKECSDKINAFCVAFFGELRSSPPAIKMHGFVVGLLYLMRAGLIICGNVEILPKVNDLAWVLPSENHVKVVFKMSTKIMTEVENFIKITVKRYSRDKLIDMGFRIV